MSALLSFSRGVDRVTTFIGRGVSWLVLLVVLVSAGNAVIRKIFDISSNAWLELQWYLFGAIFMLAAAWTLLKNEHIRVDIVSNILSKRTRDWIDFLAEDPATRSNTSICLKITADWYQALSPEKQVAKAKQLVALLEEEGVGYDFGSYRDAPAGIRIWGGATVETTDIEALLLWLDWAFAEIR